MEFQVSSIVVNIHMFPIREKILSSHFQKFSVALSMAQSWFWNQTKQRILFEFLYILIKPAVECENSRGTLYFTDREITWSLTTN